MTKNSSGVALVRVPHGYRFNCLTIAEEPIITYLRGHLRNQPDLETHVYDFHLDQSTTLHTLLDGGHHTYVIALRESGENFHYAKRVGHALLAHGKQVIIYGQTARLRHMPELDPRLEIVWHDEGTLGEKLGLDRVDYDFARDARAHSYFSEVPLADWQRKRWMGAIESSRGCMFGCRFCFINQGKNYPDRWALRSNEGILEDIDAYMSQGVRNIWFYDSEFLGDRDDDHGRRKELLTAIAQEYPGARLKIFARADTLLQFNDFDLLKRANVVQVFVGVESFDDEDLRALNKRSTGAQMKRAVEELKERNIFCHMNFITFNRNTRTESIRNNLRVLDELSATKVRLLGTPSYTFAFESDWRPIRGAESNRLSDATYIKVDLLQKSQPSGSEPVFDTTLEPLMEIYRLLSYEWNKKLVRLSLARPEATLAEKAGIASWFANIYRFCLGEQATALRQFEDGQLRLNTLADFSKALFDRIGEFHRRHLPHQLADLETYSEHAGELTYDEDATLLESREYWADAIPMEADGGHRSVMATVG